jgi:hypothetical protein
VTTWKRGDDGVVLIDGYWCRMNVVTRTRKPSPGKPERWRVCVFSIPYPDCFQQVDVKQMRKKRPKRKAGQ